MTATCMNHAVVNDNHAVRKKVLVTVLGADCPCTLQILQNYLSGILIVPVTLHHFKMLARLGRAPVRLLLDLIPFYSKPVWFRTTCYFKLSRMALDFSFLTMTT